MTNEERIALLAKYDLSLDSWIYASRSRQLHSSWFRVDGATIIHANESETGCYSYAVVPSRMANEDRDGSELVLVSRPDRAK